MNQTVVAYHANCNDGKGAALAACLALGESADYIPVQYGQPVSILRGYKRVYILDFSFSASETNQLLEDGAEVIVIDHHKTSAQELGNFAPIDPSRFVFIHSESNCGAVLAWRHFMPHADPPGLFKYIEARDLWLDGPIKADADAVKYALDTKPDFKGWTHFFSEEDCASLISAGKAIQSFIETQIERMIHEPLAKCHFPGMEVAAFVPAYNCSPAFASDLLHAALELYAEAPFAISYFDIASKGIRVYQLRSRTGSDVDVSEFARSQGGGGHKHAAGFSVELLVTLPSFQFPDKR